MSHAHSYLIHNGAKFRLFTMSYGKSLASLHVAEMQICLHNC